MSGSSARATGRVHRFEITTMALVSAVLLGIGACGGDSGGDSGDDDVASEPLVTEGPAVDEVRFSSDGFRLVGDLVLPDREGPHPAVIVVHGDGSQTRTSTPGTQIVLDKFGSAGFAVLAWDKPGSGESTGDFEQGRTLRQRAGILAAGVEFLADHPAIDADRIGLWGLSQAGWVMPMALERTDDVAFMIVVSGGGEDSIEQLGYQLGQNVICEGLTPEQGDLVATYFPRTAKGPDYGDYVEAMDVLVEIDGWEDFVGPTVKSEDEWQPWPSEIDAYFDPISVIGDTTIPVLAVFGAMDRYVDPVQGAAAYRSALQAAGNPNSHVELIPGVGHIMQIQATPCGGGGTTSERYLELLDEWIVMLTGTA